MGEPVRTAAQVWEPTHPRAAPELLVRLTCPSWIAGGWALDLFMGRESRPLAGIDPPHPWLEVLAAPRGKECA